MDMDLKSKFSLHRRLFLFLLAFSWILLVCFVTFQYGREKHFKAERLDAQLQLINTHLLDAIDTGADNAKAIATHCARFSNLRITVIDFDGRVRYDSAEPADSVALLPNHLQRPEVAEALRNGTGYTIRRLSQSTHTQYFYSAMRGEHAIVRSALPYSLPLREVLTADRGFLWFMLSITLIMSIIGYLFTRRLGHNITRLRDFAERAEQGRDITDTQPFSHDELGDISAHIVRLYAKLHQTTVDRDREHATALFEEQEKIRIKKQLTNNINHELKTPVAVIKGYLETILDNPQMDSTQRTAFIEKSKAQTERLNHLLTDVATITRMDEASQLISKEQIVVNQIIDEITADVQLLPAERRMRIHCDFTHPVIVEGNASLISSIFHNLTDNATAYSMGRDIFIRLLNEDEMSYTFLFADNGIGIEEEHLPRIFERFYRVDKGRSRKLGGTGLGLAIVKNAVLLHGGTIEARNSERGGLEFVFTLSKKG
ncbi:MAG: ATP-binding protein [Alistipes sp.]